MEAVIILSLMSFSILGLWLHEKNQHEKTRYRMNNENYKWQQMSEKWYACFQSQKEDNRRLIDKLVLEPLEKDKP